MLVRTGCSAIKLSNDSFIKGFEDEVQGTLDLAILEYLRDVCDKTAFQAFYTFRESSPPVPTRELNRAPRFGSIAATLHYNLPADSRQEGRVKANPKSIRGEGMV